MKGLIRTILSVVGLVASGTCAAYSWSGTIDWVALRPSGIVTVSSRSSGLNVFYVCQIGTTAYGVGPDACSAILVSLLAAKASEANVTWEFSDSLTCNRATYNGGNWYALNDGTSIWYYGPQVQ